MKNFSEVKAVRSALVLYLFYFFFRNQRDKLLKGGLWGAKTWNVQLLYLPYHLAICLALSTGFHGASQITSVAICPPHTIMGVFSLPGLVFCLALWSLPTKLNLLFSEDLSHITPLSISAHGFLAAHAGSHMCHCPFSADVSEAQETDSAYLLFSGLRTQLQIHLFFERRFV